jgi:hypothetical protein
MVMRGSVTPPSPTPFYKQASGQIYKDDVNVFLSTLGYYLALCLLRQRKAIGFGKKKKKLPHYE